MDLPAVGADGSVTPAIELLPTGEPALGVGVHLDVPKGRYLSDPCATPSLSVSVAKEILRSPAHARLAHPRLGGQGRAASAAMVRGTVLDSLLLGGDAQLVVMPEELPDAKGLPAKTNGERRLKSAKEWAEAQELLGNVVLSSDALHTALENAAAIKSNLMERWGLALDGQNQVTLVWEDQGATCRGRLDHVLAGDALASLAARAESAQWLPRGISALILDLKCVENADPEGVADLFHRYGYDIQAAAYTQGFEALHPELAGRVAMAFAFAEPYAPHETLVVPPAGSMRQLGAWKWSKALTRWTTCLDAGKWPGYAGPPRGVEARPWAMFAMENEGVPAGGSPGVPW